MLDGGKVSVPVLKTQILKGTPNTFKPSRTIAGVLSIILK
jgi:hypothetical protein